MNGRLRSGLGVRKKRGYGRGWFHVAVTATLLTFAKVMEVGFGEKGMGKGKTTRQCTVLY
jgi:hypothetical protein